MIFERVGIFGLTLSSLLKRAQKLEGRRVSAFVQSHPWTECRESSRWCWVHQ